MVAKSIAQATAALKLPHAYSSAGNFVTLSQGLSSIIPSSQVSVNTLIATADLALYQAKQNGRNQFCVYQSQISKVDRA